jgi:hypothetical protein
MLGFAQPHPIGSVAQWCIGQFKWCTGGAFKWCIRGGAWRVVGDYSTECSSSIRNVNP